MFALIRTTRVEQGQTTVEGEYDFEGEQIVWEQMMTALKRSPKTQTIFDQAYALASTLIKEADIS